MTNNKLSNDEQLELARWLLERYDGWRVSIASRSATIFSANALILAGVTFLADKALSLGVPSNIERIILFVGIIIAFILSMLSMIFSTNAMALVWKTSRKTAKPLKVPKILFFHSRDTLSVVQDFDDYRERFNAATKDQLLNYALGELMLSTQSHIALFDNLRRALRLVIFSIIPFFVSLVILLLNIFR